uniref:Uncharacterized protein n=1 Tax=Bactrocera dorsalis TaxID=27457 RepID=A0A034WQU7_BACDO
MIKFFYVVFTVLVVAMAVMAEEESPTSISTDMPLESSEPLPPPQVLRSVSDSEEGGEESPSAAESSGVTVVAMSPPMLLMGLLVLLFVNKRGEFINFKLL